jgi:hypothetical protein
VNSGIPCLLRAEIGWFDLQNHIRVRAPPEEFDVTFFVDQPR